jgi:putative transcriptional regulator
MIPKKVLLLIALIGIIGCKRSEKSENQRKLKIEKEVVKDCAVKVGQYIVAIPNFPSPIFEKAVILVTQIENGNITGVFINKFQNKKLGNLLTEYKGSNLQVFSGGPVNKNYLLHIHTLESDIPNTREVLPGLYFMGNIDALTEKIKANEIPEDKIRFFNGYVGWKESQFQEEFQEGVWLITNAKKTEIMNMENYPTWESLIRRIQQ